MELRTDTPEFQEVTRMLRGPATVVSVRELCWSAWTARDWALDRSCRVVLREVPSVSDPRDAAARDRAHTALKLVDGTVIGREEYEEAVRRFGFEPLADHVCELLADVGPWNWPEYTVEYAAASQLMRRRGRTVRNSW
jgi:hypothetical protein